jgi:hypothetical protein
MMYAFAAKIYMKTSVLADKGTYCNQNLFMITIYGVTQNQYANMLVQNEVKMDDLFIPIL